MNTKLTDGKRSILANQRIKERDYWLKHLEGDWSKTIIPYDGAQTLSNLDTEGQGPGRTGSMTISVPAETASLLERISKGNDFALNAILAAALNLLLHKYTARQDIIIGAPVFLQNGEGEYINTALVLKSNLTPSMSFKELLVQTKKTIDEAVEHQNYPVELLPEQLGRTEPGNDFPLFDISVLLESIHDKTYLEGFFHNLQFTFKKNGGKLLGNITYNPARYSPETVERVAGCYTGLLGFVLEDVNINISDTAIFSQQAKQDLLSRLNDTGADYPREQTIHELFRVQAQKNPEKTALHVPIAPEDLSNIQCCFKKASFIHRAEFGKYQPAGPGTPEISFSILKTRQHGSMVVNRNTVTLLEQFDGQSSVEALFQRLRGLKDIPFILFPVPPGDMLEITIDFRRQAQVFCNMELHDWTALVKLLYTHHLVEPFSLRTRALPGASPLTPSQFDAGPSQGIDFTVAHMLEEEPPSSAEVLLLGDTPGTPTTGLLYMASYLRRSDISACVRFYDDSQDFDALRKDIETWLDRLQPRVVAISLKWFPYIARVLETCRIVREYSTKKNASITIVVGGNTASYYWEEIIQNPEIDYIIRGDGELPLLNICRGNTGIPNCVHMENGQVVQAPMSYAKTRDNAEENYLSHLDQVILNPRASKFSTFFIYTHLGCQMNCLYCGGCRDAQAKTFGRDRVFMRPAAEVRKDIRAALPLVSTFQWDFDIVRKDLAGYCRDIWDGIDLSNHFCIISSLKKPDPQLIQLVCETFGYVYWDLDVLTLSQRHRKQLQSLGLVKPQLSDDDILEVLAECDKYPNIDVRVNLINGLPHLQPEDLSAGEALLARMMSSHTSFSELHWARLHAQPGAPIVESAATYDMHSFATNYEDFLEYSRKNFSHQAGQQHSRLEFLNYPYVYFNDDALNSKLTLHYSEVNRKVIRYAENRFKESLPLQTLTYRELDEASGSVANTLNARGISTGHVVALMLSPSLHLPLGILSVLKAGAGFLPIEPGYPPDRINYMLRDSQAAAVITSGPLPAGVDFHKEHIRLDQAVTETGESPHSPSPAAGPEDPVYIIYTSGTTGKPKGVMLKHRNLVNYVHWFKTFTQLSSGDNSLLTSSYAFDLGYTSIFPALLSGSGLHIVPRDTYMSSDQLILYIRRHQVTYLKITPSLFSVLIQSPEFTGGGSTDLRLVVMGGEPIDMDDVETAHQVYPRLKIINHYGPTEATIGCIAQYIDFQNLAPYKAQPTIGRPIANTGVYILDKDATPLPVGVPGELCISGDALARGYLNRPELTREKFIPNPWMEGQHIYRTGDRARRLNNGLIEFLGRVDNQVKIRGYRIELGEIQQQIQAHPLVEESAVIVRDDPDRDKYLCAYIVPGTSTGGGTEALRELKPASPGIPAFQAFEQAAEQNPAEIALPGAQGYEAYTYEVLNRTANRIAHQVIHAYDDRFSLSGPEKMRYKRQMLLDGWGTGSQEKLKETTVFIAGAGGGASPTITQLALAGVGAMIVCDFDVVELSNLNRQFLHDESRIGMNKALSAQMTVKKLNPNVKVIPITEKLTPENAFKFIGNSSIIFDMFDGMDSKFVLSECAVALGIPHVIAAMNELSAYCAIFHTPHTPCYHCLYDREKIEELNRIRGVVDNYEKNPLHVVASSLFNSSGFIVTETLKLLLEMENPAYNKFILFNHKASESVVNTDGYKMMTYPFSEHFRRSCREQGFDWDKGWRGKLLEELEVEKYPGCPMCGPKGAQKVAALKQEAETQTRSHQDGQPPAAAVTAAPTTEKHATVALLLSNELHRLPEALLGVIKAGKTLVPIDPTLPQDQLLQVLSQADPRVFITTQTHLSMVESIRDSFNHRLPVLNLDNPGESPGDRERFSRENPRLPMEGEKTAALLYPEAGGPLHGAVISVYEALQEGRPLPVPQTAVPDTPAPDKDPVSQVKAQLAAVLPEYMVPSGFVTLDKMPLTPNGKIDRSALPKPEAAAAGHFTPPRNDLERLLARIWAELLGLEEEKVGINHNFFELGGTSLDMINLVSKVYQETGLELSITQIFENPVIEDIAMAVNSRKITEDHIGLLNNDNEKKIFAFPPQMAFGLYYTGAASMFDDYAFYAANFIEDENRLEQYVQLMTQLQPQGPFVLFGYSAATRLTWETAKALEDHGRTVSGIVFLDCFLPEDRHLELGEEFFSALHTFIDNNLERWGVSFLKDSVKDKADKYMRYNQDLSNLPVINANVHLILSDEYKDIGKNHGWNELTTKDVTIYQGTGEHLAVFNPGNLEVNTRIMKQILKDIKF